MKKQRQGVQELEVGCGYARDSIYLARTGFDAVGIDVSAEALRLARNWANSDGLKIDFMHMDITNNSFEDSGFDTVIMFNTFHFMLKKVRERSISEIYRILRSGGLFVQAMFSRREKDLAKSVKLRPIPSNLNGAGQFTFSRKTR